VASKAVEDAVDAYLAAHWTHSSVCPILMENNQGDAPDDGSSFLLVQFPISNVTRPTVNQRYYREEGGFRIVINVERGGGTAKIRQYGDELSDIFRDQKFSGVNTLVPSEPFTDDSSDQGNYFTGAMVVPFTFNFVG
jgi:hypothetical protein